MNNQLPKLFHTIVVTGLTLFCAALTLSSCSKKPADALIGKWNQDGKSTTVEFRPDGTLINTENGKLAHGGKYKFTDSSHLQMEVFAEGSTNVEMTLPCEFAVKGDMAVLGLIAPGTTNQVMVHLTRVK